MNYEKIIVISFFSFMQLTAQNTQDASSRDWDGKFEQLGRILPSPNIYRTASRAPGYAYWQNRADYNISAYLDENKRNLKGSETITYYNNSPDNLDYIWLQLDENQTSSLNKADYDFSSTLPKSLNDQQLKITDLPVKENGYGINLEKVTDVLGAPSLIW